MRLRLNLLAIAVTSMMAVAFLIPLLGLVADIVRDRALGAAEQDAQLVAQLITTSADVAEPTDALAVLAPSGLLNGRAISVATQDGRVAGAPIPADQSLESAFAGAATNSAVPGGRAVLVPAIQVGGNTAVVRVFVTDEEMTAGVTTARLVLVSLSVVLVAIAVLATDRLARAIIAPVEELSRASADLAEGNLDARVSPSGPPEIVEVGQRFNRLAGEVEALLQAERETAADLSHRLRTPLTAARLDVEGIDDPATREVMMADLDNIERSVDHAIEVLRAPGRAVAAKSAVEPVVRDRVAFWEPLAAEQGRSATAHLPDTRTPVAVAEDDLVAAIDALIGNVFTHTPDGTDFQLTVEITNEFATVRVEDAGPGFADLSLEARGASAGGSTGLGLDIARRTAELAGGSIALGRSPLGGASVQLIFSLQ